MLGIVTLRGSAREARRSVGIMLLVFAGLGEAYWAYTVPISIPSRHKQTDTIMVRLSPSPQNFPTFTKKK
jgi:hypothetical protein